MTKRKIADFLWQIVTQCDLVAVNSLSSGILLREFDKTRLNVAR